MLATQWLDDAMAEPEVMNVARRRSLTAAEISRETRLDGVAVQDGFAHVAADCECKDAVSIRDIRLRKKNGAQRTGASQVHEDGVLALAAELQKVRVGWQTGDPNAGYF